LTRLGRVDTHLSLTILDAIQTHDTKGKGGDRARWEAGSSRVRVSEKVRLKLSGALATEGRIHVISGRFRRRSDFLILITLGQGPLRTLRRYTLPRDIGKCHLLCSGFAAFNCRKEFGDVKLQMQQFRELILVKASPGRLNVVVVQDCDVRTEARRWLTILRSGSMRRSVLMIVRPP